DTFNTAASSENIDISNDESETSYLGKLEYSLCYRTQKEELKIQIVEISGYLSNADGITDLFVKLQFLPDIGKRIETKPHRIIDTKSEIGEAFTVKDLSVANKQDKTLIFHIYATDRKVRFDLIGELRVDLNTLDHDKVTRAVKGFTVPTLIEENSIKEKKIKVYN
ncbi:unnamed protein product, partial [Didymodactylos carnosus]